MAPPSCRSRADVRDADGDVSFEDGRRKTSPRFAHFVPRTRSGRQQRAGVTTGNVVTVVVLPDDDGAVDSASRR